MKNEILVTSIEPQKKKKLRYNLYSEGEYICSLSADSLVKFGIKQGALISENELKEAVEADNSQYAFDSAANLLSFKMRTKTELRDKLLSKRIEENAVDCAIDKLESYGYINDKLYAKEFVDSAVLASRYGRKVVEFKLKQKGIDDDTIAEALQHYTDDEESRIAKLQLERLLKKYDGEDKGKSRQKIYSTLTRRGFSFDIINSVLSEDVDFD